MKEAVTKSKKQKETVKLTPTPTPTPTPTKAPDQSSRKVNKINKVARELNKLLTTQISSKKSGKMFKKHTNLVALTLNVEAKKIAKEEKRKVVDVQKEIINKFQVYCK